MASHAGWGSRVFSILIATGTLVSLTHSVLGAELSSATPDALPGLGYGTVYKGTGIFLDPITQTSYALSLWQSDGSYIDLLLVTLPRDSKGAARSRQIRGILTEPCRVELAAESRVIDPITKKIYFGCQGGNRAAIIEIDTQRGVAPKFYWFNLQAFKSAVAGADGKVYFGSAAFAFEPIPGKDSRKISGDNKGHLIAIDPAGVEANAACPGQPVCDLGSLSKYVMPNYGYHYYLHQLGTGTSSFVYAAIGQNPWLLAAINVATGEKAELIQPVCAAPCGLQRISHGAFQRRGGNSYFVFSSKGNSMKVDLYVRLDGLRFEPEYRYVIYDKNPAANGAEKLVGNSWVRAKLPNSEGVAPLWDALPQESEVFSTEPTSELLTTGVKFQRRLDKVEFAAPAKVRSVPIRAKLLHAESKSSMLAYSLSARVIERMKLGGERPELLVSNAFSVYSAVNLPGSVLFSGYPNAIGSLELATGKFTQIPSPIPAKYFFFSDVERGLNPFPWVFLAAHYERTGSGGGLVWYNPAQKTFGAERGVFLTDPVTNSGILSPAGLAVGQGAGSGFVLYSGLANIKARSEARVLAFKRDKLVRKDPDGNPLVKGRDYLEVYPIAECPQGRGLDMSVSPAKLNCQAGPVISTPSGHFVGVYRYLKQVGPRSFGNFTKLYVWDPRSRSTVFESEIKGIRMNAGTNSSSGLSIAPDGDVWFLAGSSVYSLSMKDYSVTLRMTDPKLTAAYQLVWVGSRLFTFSGEELLEIK